MFTKRGRGIYSVLLAILTWLFIRRPQVEDQESLNFTPNEQFIYLTSANVDELQHGNWYVVAGEITDKSVVTHNFEGVYNIAHLSVDSFSSTRIAACLGVKCYGEVIPISEGILHNQPGKTLDLNQKVDWISMFDYYFFFWSVEMKRTGFFTSYAREQVQSILVSASRLVATII